MRPNPLVYTCVTLKVELVFFLFPGAFNKDLPVVLFMEEILHQLIGSLSPYLQGFIHPRWCRISSINRMYHQRIQVPNLEVLYLMRLF